MKWVRIIGAFLALVLIVTTFIPADLSVRTSGNLLSISMRDVGADSPGWLSGYGSRIPIATVLDESVVEDYQLPVTVWQDNQTGTQALEFTGAEHAKTELSTFPVGKNSLTMEAWVQFSEFDIAHNLWRALVNVREGSANRRFWDVGVIGTAGAPDTWVFRAAYFDGSATTVSSSNVNPDTWYHVALVYDSATGTHGTLRLYVNGSEQGSGAALHQTPILALPADLRLALKDTDIDPAACLIDELRISDKARTSTEITAAYNSGSGARLTADANTIALYHADELHYAIAQIASTDGIHYGTTLSAATLGNGDIIVYYYKGDSHMWDYTTSKICYKTSSDGGYTWSSEVDLYSPSRPPNIHVLPGGGVRTPDDNFVLFMIDTVGAYHTNPTRVSFFRSTDGTTWGSPSTLLDYDWTEDFLGTDRGKAFTGVDTSGRLTVTSDRITAAGLDTDESGYVYYDLTSAFVDYLDVYFDIRISSDSDVGAVGGMGFAAALGDISTFGTSDLSVTARKTDTSVYRIYIARGNDTATDYTAISADTTYYCRLTRAHEGTSASVSIYTSAANRDNDTSPTTITVSGVTDSAKHRYVYGFVNKGGGAGGQEFDGYVENLSLRLGAFITGGMIDVPTKGLMQIINFYWLGGGDNDIHYFRVGALWSDDDGVTWEGPSTIVDAPAAELNESSIAYVGDGRLVILTRSQAMHDGNAYFYQIVSDDYGDTWGSVEDTLWNGQRTDNVNGSMVQVVSDGDSVFACVNNRKTERLEVTQVSADVVIDEATAWNDAPKYNAHSQAGKWVGYLFPTLADGNSAPNFHIAHVVKRDTNYQELYMAIPGGTWDGKQGHNNYIYDSSQNFNHLTKSALTVQSATGKFSSTYTSRHNDVFLSGNCTDSFYDVRWASLDGDTELYHYIVQQAGGISAEYAVNAPKVGSSKLTGDSGTDKVLDVTTGTVFSVGDWVIIEDDDNPLGEVNKIAGISTNELTFENNFSVSYLTAKNARVCHGVYLYYDKPSATGYSASLSGNSTYQFFDDANTGSVSDKWTEANAYGESSYSTAQQRMGSKSLYYKQTSSTVGQNYLIDGNAYDQLGNSVISFWALHTVSGDHLLMHGRGDVSVPFTHIHGGLATSSLLYNDHALANIDTGHDYVQWTWERFDLYCTGADKKIVWMKDGFVIARDAHRHDDWTYIDQLTLSSVGSFPSEYWYLDQITARKWEPTLTITVGGGEVGDPEITSTPDNYDFGVLEVNTTAVTGLDYFTITNTGGVAVDITIQGTDLTGGVDRVISAQDTSAITDVTHLHGLIYYDGYLYGTSRTSPGKVAQIDVSDLSSFSLLTPQRDTGVDCGALMDVVEADGYIWTLDTYGWLYKIDPSDLTQAAKYQILTTAVSSNDGALCTDGTYIFGTGYGYVARFKLSDNTHTSAEVVASKLFHSIAEYGDHVYVSDVTDLVVRKVLKSDLSLVATSGSVGAGCTDDMAIDDTYVYLGREIPTGGIVRVTQSDLTVAQLAGNIGMGLSYGVFKVNDGTQDRLINLDFENNILWVLALPGCSLVRTNYLSGLGASDGIAELASDGTNVYLSQWVTSGNTPTSKFTQSHVFVGDGDDHWTLAADATPGENTYGLKAGLEGGDYTIIVKKSATYNTLKTNLAASATQKWGLKLWMPTSVLGYAAQEMSGTVTLVASAAS